MSLWDRIVYGVDLDAEQARGEQLDAQLEALNRQRLDSGRWTLEQWQTAENNRQAGATGDVRGQVREAAVEGALDGVRAIPSAINKGLKAPFQFLGVAIPWQVWLLGLGALFLYLGGGVYLRGILARR